MPPTYVDQALEISACINSIRSSIEGCTLEGRDNGNIVKLWRIMKFKGISNIQLVSFKLWLTTMLVERSMHNDELAYVTLDEQAQEFLFG